MWQATSRIVGLLINSIDRMMLVLRTLQDLTVAGYGQNDVLVNTTSAHRVKKAIYNIQSDVFKITENMHLSLGLSKRHRPFKFVSKFGPMIQCDIFMICLSVFGVLCNCVNFMLLYYVSFNVVDINRFYYHSYIELATEQYFMGV